MPHTKYTKQEIAEMLDVYEPSGHNLTVAGQMLIDIIGYSPPRTTLKRYWLKEGYKLNPRGSKVQRTKSSYGIDPRIRERILIIHAATKENWGITSAADIARVLGVNYSTVKKVLTEARKREQGDLESKVARCQNARLLSL